MDILALAFSLAWFPNPKLITKSQRCGFWGFFRALHLLGSLPQSLGDASGGTVPMECLGTDWQLCVVAGQFCLPPGMCSIQCGGSGPLCSWGLSCQKHLGVFKMILQIFFEIFLGFLLALGQFLLVSDA